ncbi:MULTISPECIES: hypothetical protein [Streptosporangium]|uniref:Uncharacterized protein n=1 Tax=Streptosporangium jomthongense TaxID=1193683 RepID=A0ABV8F2I9_9ACTN
MECPAWCDGNHGNRDALTTTHRTTVWKGLHLTITASQTVRPHSPGEQDGPSILLTIPYAGTKPAVRLSPGAARALAAIIEKSDGRGGTEYLVAELRHAADLLAPTETH